MRAGVERVQVPWRISPEQDRRKRGSKDQRPSLATTAGDVVRRGRSGTVLDKSALRLLLYELIKFNNRPIQLHLAWMVGHDPRPDFIVRGTKFGGAVPAKKARLIHG